MLTVTEILRSHGVVDKFVEFFGDGMAALSLPDRATIANMSPEYGATMGFFPVDQVTIDYMRLTGRTEEQIALSEAYAKANDLWFSTDKPVPSYTSVLELDLSKVQPSLAGPKRPQDRILLSRMKPQWHKDLVDTFGKQLPEEAIDLNQWAGEGGDSSHSSVNPDAAEIQADTSRGAVGVEMNGKRFVLRHGAVVIAAITSCTNTSNPDVMLAAGLVARKARARGLTSKPWVKTSRAWFEGRHRVLPTRRV